MAYFLHANLCRERHKFEYRSRKSEISGAFLEQKAFSEWRIGVKDEKIYSIPVNEAFETDCECPVCAMYDRLETDAVDYAMGPSYMEADIREVTDKVGFCRKHVKMVAKKGNTLGMALVLKTHFDKVIGDVFELQKEYDAPKKSLFKKKTSGADAVTDYIKKLECSCFVCDRVDNTFARYVDTIFYLWKSSDEFRENFKKTKGFCTSHYALLREKAPEALGQDSLNEFIKVLDALYITNMERVRDDLEWLIKRFDYRYANEPVKNSKDAIPRAVTKINSVNIEGQG